MALGSDFSKEGLPIGEESTNMTYLYGVSDFFSIMFQDTAKLNLMLEAGAESASDIYSKFLQMTSSLSLEDIQSTIGSQIKLITLRSSSAVQGRLNTFEVDPSLVSASFIANKPLLPTALLEEDVDFRIERQANGKVYLRFAHDISRAGFATRLLSDGQTKEYAMWFVDAEIDEQMIYKHFGRIIQVKPQSSSELFRSFVYGLYFTYMHGPSLENLRKGLNLTLGIPLARDKEIVIDIRTYLDTDQYIVICERNQYIVPYGLPPIVRVGQQLEIGDEIAQWVEIKDYINDGEWWVNLFIPAAIIPNLPAGQNDRYAKEGSHFDSLMRNYLKKHTFLVNVKVENFKNIQGFQQLSDIIWRAKPSYTQPIYIWTVEQEETIELTDEVFRMSVNVSRCENFLQPIQKMKRADQQGPLRRGCPQFLRWNVPVSVSQNLGTDSFINGHETIFNNGILDGFVNQTRQFRPNTPEEKAWLRTIINRDSRQWQGNRSMLGFTRGELPDHPYEGVGVTPNIYDIPSSHRMIPLYITKIRDIEAKCDALSLVRPRIDQWFFEFFNPHRDSHAINEFAINEEENPDAMIPYQLRDNYDLLMRRGADIGYLGSVVPDIGYKHWSPGPGLVEEFDYLLCVRIFDDIVGVYWVTESRSREIPVYDIVTDPDALEITFNRSLTRGSNYLSNPFYFIRSRGALNYDRVTPIDPDDPNFIEIGPNSLNNTGINVSPLGGMTTDLGVEQGGTVPGTTEVNGDAVNEEENPDYDLIDVTYTDDYNTATVQINRSDTTLVHALRLGM